MEIINKIDNLTRERFVFTFIDYKIVLNEYYYETKEKKRDRKWNVKKTYDRIFKRRTDTELTDIHIPETIKTKIKEKYCAKIKVVKELKRY